MSDKKQPSIRQQYKMAIISAWGDTGDDTEKHQKYRAMKAGQLADALLEEDKEAARSGTDVELKDWV